MGQLGIHFALTEEQLGWICEATSDQELIRIIQEDIEAQWNDDWMYESDKAWDAIHRCLCDGRLEATGGNYPLNAAVLGGKSLLGGQNYIVSLLLPEQVKEVAQALSSVTVSILEDGYTQLQEVFPFSTRLLIGKALVALSHFAIGYIILFKPLRGNRASLWKIALRFSYRCVQ